jgi:hypothetical protein
MNRTNLQRIATLASLARCSLLCVLICGLGGCVTDPPPTLASPPPYMLLPVDEMMSCNAIAASFRFSARRAARLEYWIAVGPLQSYDVDKFAEDAGVELVDERRRLEALSELQRFKGCIVSQPAAAVAEERLKLGVPIRQLQAPAVLSSRG